MVAPYTQTVAPGWLEELEAMESKAELRPGCSPERVTGAESELGVTLPEALAEFLRATDGFYDRESEYAYAWDLNTLVGENARAWTDAAAPLDTNFLAFGADGAGGWFCLPLGPESADGVFHWSATDEQPRRIAPDLRTFWRGWLTGRITV
jgi:hypothetical protein